MPVDQLYRLKSTPHRLKEGFAAGIYLSEVQNPPPPFTLYTCMQYMYLFTQGWGGGELNQREGERGNRGGYISQSLVKNTNMTECTQDFGYNL